MLHMLLKNGADLRAKDIHGDNCVHWAARTGSLPVVRYLLKNTEGAVWASMDENILRKRPIDLALEQCCERVVVLNRNENDGTGKSNEFVVPAEVWCCLGQLNTDLKILLVPCLPSIAQPRSDWKTCLLPNPPLSFNWTICFHCHCIQIPRKCCWRHTKNTPETPSTRNCCVWCRGPMSD